MRQLPVSSITTAFHEEASLKVQGIKGSTSQTQGPDETISATTLNSVKMILEGLTRLRTKVMELNPNFIQHLDVESLNFNSLC